MRETLNQQLELAWAAGYFEGEGCFSLQPRKERPNGRPQAGATVRNTDEDTLRRFHHIVGCGSVKPYKPQKEGYKPFWQWGIKGYSTTKRLISLLYPWLGNRRRARAEELLMNCGRPGHRQDKFDASVAEDRRFVASLKRIHIKRRKTI